MASAVLGPESDRTLAVIAENYQTMQNIPTLDGDEQFRFGSEYEKKMYSLINEHLELGTTDRLAYIGDQKGSLSQALEDRFCLIHPVQTVIPGHFHYIETHDGKKTLPVRVSNVGAEEYFRILATDQSLNKVKFDKILVNDCVRYMEYPGIAYKNMIACLAPRGKLLIIHRNGELSTLPYFSDACQRLRENVISYTSIIKDLELCHLDVSWQLESLPVCMPKRKWLAMVKDKFPNIEILSSMEVVSGIRELSEGILKYEGEMVEFVDRLLFISATDSDHLTTQSNKQTSQERLLPNMTNLTYFMNLEQLRDLKRQL